MGTSGMILHLVEVQGTHKGAGLNVEEKHAAEMVTNLHYRVFSFSQYDCGERTACGPSMDALNVTSSGPVLSF